jgi:2-keto-4-pentenoate hydratase
MGRDERIDRGMATQLAERRRRIDAGEHPLGWKLGMGVPAAMEKLGTEAPLVGYLLESARVESGATVDVSGWSNPKLEPEIAVHLGADVPGGTSREDAEAAIAGVGVAIELVDTGDPVELIVHVANTLAEAGETLRAGEVVICGSVVPALDVAPGDEVEVTLDPLGSLSVKFA